MDVSEKKHHCRGCGKGFCDKCSTKRMVIPWWSVAEKVRVCDKCYEQKEIPEPKIFQQSKATYFAEHPAQAIAKQNGLVG